MCAAYGTHNLRFRVSARDVGAVDEEGDPEVAGEGILAGGGLPGVIGTGEPPRGDEVSVAMTPLAGRRGGTFSLGRLSGFLERSCLILRPVGTFAKVSDAHFATGLTDRPGQPGDEGGDGVCVITPADLAALRSALLARVTQLSASRLRTPYEFEGHIKRPSVSKRDLTSPTDRGAISLCARTMSPGRQAYQRPRKSDPKTLTSTVKTTLTRIIDVTGM